MTVHISISVYMDAVVEFLEPVAFNQSTSLSLPLLVFVVSVIPFDCIVFQNNNFGSILNSKRCADWNVHHKKPIITAFWFNTPSEETLYHPLIRLIVIFVIVVIISIQYFNS